MDDEYMEINEPTQWERWREREARKFARQHGMRMQQVYREQPWLWHPTNVVEYPKKDTPAFDELKARTQAILGKISSWKSNFNHRDYGVVEFGDELEQAENVTVVQPMHPVIVEFENLKKKMLMFKNQLARTSEVEVRTAGKTRDMYNITKEFDSIIARAKQLNILLRSGDRRVTPEQAIIAIKQLDRHTTDVISKYNSISREASVTPTIDVEVDTRYGREVAEEEIYDSDTGKELDPNAVEGKDLDPPDESQFYREEPSGIYDDNIENEVVVRRSAINGFTGKKTSITGIEESVD